MLSNVYPLKPRTCSQCNKPFQPARPMQAICGQRCATAQARAAEAARKAAKRAERAKDKARLEALKKIPELIAAAQVEFNAYIRLRDKSKGCFVCGRAFDQSIPGRALHAGHVRSRGAAGHLRFNELNCLGECEGCNGPRGAKPHEIKAGAIARIGQEAFDALEADNTPHKWTREELRAIKEKYRAMRRVLEKMEAAA